MCWMLFEELSWLQVWYCVPPGEERKRFEHLARQTFPHDADKCRAFLRHKEFLISPKTLRSHGIKFVQVHPMVLQSRHTPYRIFVDRALCLKGIYSLYPPFVHRQENEYLGPESM